MTIGNALNFIERGFEDKTLRDRLNAVSNPSELKDVLADENLTFSAGDFDEAYHHRLTLCQEMEAAEQLLEFRMWWDLLGRSVASPPGSPSCRGCVVQD